MLLSLPLLFLLLLRIVSADYDDAAAAATLASCLHCVLLLHVAACMHGMVLINILFDGAAGRRCAIAGGA
jgi:hypothetical protein